MAPPLGGRCCRMCANTLPDLSGNFAGGKRGSSRASLCPAPGAIQVQPLLTTLNKADVVKHGVRRGFTSKLLCVCFFVFVFFS